MTKFAPTKYKSIPGWFKSHELYELIVNRIDHKATIVEIGCYFGRSSVYLAELLTQRNLDVVFYCLDAWRSVSSKKHASEGMNESLVKKHEKLKSQYNEDPFKIFSYLIKSSDMEDIIIPKKGPSFDHSESFEDESCDFVYIDTSNDYEDIKKEIKRWLPKMKKGGVIGGDDFSSPGVRKAVQSVFQNYNLCDYGKDKRYPDQYCTWWKEV